MSWLWGHMFIDLRPLVRHGLQVIEGTGHCAVGSIVNLNNAQVSDSTPRRWLAHSSAHTHNTPSPRSRTIPCLSHAPSPLASLRHVLPRRWRRCSA